MTKQIAEISKKIDNIPNLIQVEFSRGLELCGCDPKNPREMQRLVSWGLNSMEKEKQTMARIRNKFIDYFFIGIIGALIFFVGYYAQNVVKYTIREEQTVISEIKNGKK